MLHVKETSLKTAKDATSILKSISKVAAQAQADIKPKPGGGGQWARTKLENLWLLWTFDTCNYTRHPQVPCLYITIKDIKFPEVEGM